TDAARIDARESGATGPAAYKPTLLRDAPSGAILAVSFKNVNELLARLQSAQALGTALPPFVAQLKGISGDGVLSVAPGALLPVVTLEVRPQDPAAAANSLRALASRIGNALPLHVTREGAKVLLTNAAGNPSSSGSLV